MNSSGDIFASAANDAMASWYRRLIFRTADQIHSVARRVREVGHRSFRGTLDFAFELAARIDGAFDRLVDIIDREVDMHRGPVTPGVQRGLSLHSTWTLHHP